MPTVVESVRYSVWEGLAKLMFNEVPLREKEVLVCSPIVCDNVYNAKKFAFQLKGKTVANPVSDLSVKVQFSF